MDRESRTVGGTALLPLLPHAGSRRALGAPVCAALPMFSRLAGTMQSPPGARAPLLLKIYGGTPVQEGESLCETCRHSRIVRGRRLEDELVICGPLVMEAVRIMFKVTSCTEYADGREPTYHELVEKAWILLPQTKRRPAGFIRSADLTSREIRRAFAPMRDEE